jgi:transposase
MDYPQAVIAKAQKMEKLLRRVAQGEPLAQVCAELEVEVNEKQLAKLQAKYEAGGERWEALLDGRYGHTQKVHSAMLAWLYERKKQDQTLRAPKLADEMAEKFGVRVAPGHINHLLRKRELTAPPGRPYKHPPAEQAEEPSPTGTELLDNAGTFFPGSSQGRDGGSSDP